MKIDLDARHATGDCVSVRLTPLEFRILATLARRPGKAEPRYLRTEIGVGYRLSLDG